MGAAFSNAHLPLNRASEYLVGRVTAAAGEGPPLERLQRMCKFAREHYNSRGAGELYGSEIQPDAENQGLRDTLKACSKRAARCIDLSLVVWVASKRLGLPVDPFMAQCGTADGRSGIHAYLRTTQNGEPYIVSPNWKRDPIVTEKDFLAKGYWLFGETPIHPRVTPEPL